MSKYMLRTGDTWHLNGDGGRRYSSIDPDDVAHFALDADTRDTITIRDGAGKERYILTRASDWSELMFYHVRCGECRGLKQVPKSEVVLP